jgi:hypothetical protein
MTSKSLTAVYNGGVQQGDGFMDWIRGAQKIHKFVKDNKLISKGANIASTLGADKYLNAKTGGKYGKATGFAKSKGYGKKTKAKPKAKPRKR